MGGSRTGKPGDAEAAAEPRVAAAFRAWLGALATDADAATAAAMAYEALPPDGRDAWLDALEIEAPAVDVPLLALYAPLLGVETDETRSKRIDVALSAAQPPSQPGAPRALRGLHSSGDTVVALVIPLYLDFVELLVCRYRTDVGLSSVRRGPLVSAGDVFGASPSAQHVDGTPVVEVPLAMVVEELAHAVLADRREGRAPPESLTRYEFLFTPDLSHVVLP